MTRDSFSDKIRYLVGEFMNCFDCFDSDPQIRIDPSSFDVRLVNGREMHAEIEDSIEAVESAAGADGEALEESTDFQVRRNPDFVPVRSLIVRDGGGKAIADESAIRRVVDTYFPVG